MELQLIGGAQGQGGGAGPAAAASESGAGRLDPSAIVGELAEAARLVVATRQRLEALADRLAELRRRVGGSDGSGTAGGRVGGVGFPAPR